MAKKHLPIIASDPESIAEALADLWNAATNDHEAEILTLTDYITGHLTARVLTTTLLDLEHENPPAGMLANTLIRRYGLRF